MYQVGDWVYYITGEYVKITEISEDGLSYKVNNKIWLESDRFFSSKEDIIKFMEENEGEF